MGALSLRLPESLHTRVRNLAKKDGVSANQFITLGVAERCAALAALERAGVDGVPPAPAPEEVAAQSQPEAADGLLVRRRLLALAQYLRELRSIAAEGRDRYRQHWHLQRAGERSLQLAIDVCADLAEHIVGDQHLRKLGSTTAAFDLLGEAGVIDTPLAASFTRMTRLRNMLVRGDVRLDATRVYDGITADASEMERFADVMRRLIREAGRR